MTLGYFATAEEAALCIARSPEGQAAAKRAVSAAPHLSEEEGKGAVPPMPPGAFVKEEDMPPAPVVKEEGAVPPMPSDAYVKTEAVVKEEERSGGRPKYGPSGRERSDHPLGIARTVRESVLQSARLCRRR